MTRNLLLAAGSIGAIAIITASACTVTSTDTSSTGSGASSSSSSNGGNGGSTSSNGGGGDGGSTTSSNNGGSGGGPACASCGEYIGGAELADVCGFVSVDENTNEITCNAGSSCEFLVDLQICTCAPSEEGGCLEACPEACEGGPTDDTCIPCVTGSCNAEFNACTSDTGTEGG